MKKHILGAVLSLGILVSPALTQAAGLTTNQANTLIAVVQSSPGTPASAFVNLITAFSNITTAQAASLITVVQSAPGVAASSFVNLLISFSGGVPEETPTPTAAEALETARAKGNDAAIKSNFSTIQTQAEIYYGSHNNTYTSVCSDTVVGRALTGAWTANGGAGTACSAVATAYAAQAFLASDKTKFWCVDSTGFSGETTTPLGSSVACATTTGAPLPPPTSSTATVTVNGTPALQLGYDSAYKEASLSAMFEVKITAGSSDFKLYKTGSYWADNSNTHAFLVKLQDTNANGSDTNGSYQKSSGTAVDNGTHWLIPSGQTATFKLSAALANPKTLFAGTYTAALSMYVLGNSGGTTAPTVSNGMTNAVTIIGEVSPYISSVASDSGGTITVQGARLNLSGNTVVIDGSKTVTAWSSTASSLSFDYNAYQLPNGTHPLQITNTQTGNSNTVYFSLNRNAAGAPTIDSLTLNGSTAPAAVAQGGLVTIAWTSHNTGHCTGYGQNVQLTDGTSWAYGQHPASGSKSFVMPSTTSVTIGLQCWENAAGPSKSITREISVPLGTTASPATITVTSPNGGEVWRIGDTYTLRWQSQGSSVASYPVQIGIIDTRYSTEGGSRSEQIIANSVSNTGSYVWTVPQSVGTMNLGDTYLSVYKIIVHSWSDSVTGVAVSDSSDATFAFGIATPNATSATVRSPLSAATDASFTISGTASPAGSYVYVTTGSIGGAALVSSDGSWSLPVSAGRFSAGTYTITVNAYSSTGVKGAVLATGTLAVTAPVVTPAPTATISLSGGTVSWTSSNASECSLYDNYGYIIKTGSVVENRTGFTGTYAGGSLAGQAGITYNYGCSNSSGATGWKSVAVPVAAPTATIQATNTGVVSWSSTGATECSLYDNAGYIIKTGVAQTSGFSGSYTSGSLTASSGNTYNYGCSNTAGSTGWKSVRVYTYTAGTETPVSTSQSPKCACDVSQGRDCASSFVSADQGAACYEFYNSQTDPLGGPLYKSITYTRGGSVSAAFSGTSQTASVLNALFGAKSAGGSATTGSARFGYEWSKDLKYGSTDAADVGALQIALTQEGIYKGDITGGFYNQTLAAVQSFQQKYGIEATGFVGAMTRAKLNSLYAK